MQRWVSQDRRTRPETVDLGGGPGEIHLHATHLLSLCDHLGRADTQILAVLGVHVGDGLAAIGHDHGHRAVGRERAYVGALALHCYVEAHLVSRNHRVPRDDATVRRPLHHNRRAKVERQILPGVLRVSVCDWSEDERRRARQT